MQRKEDTGQELRQEGWLADDLSRLSKTCCLGTGTQKGGRWGRGDDSGDWDVVMTVGGRRGSSRASA